MSQIVLGAIPGCLTEQLSGPKDSLPQGLLFALYLHMPTSLLKEAELGAEFLEHMFDGLPDLMLVTDEHGRIRACNASIREMFGFEPEATRGRFLSDLVGSAHWNELAPLFRIQDQAARARQLRIGRRITGIKQDGSTFPISLNIAEFERHSGRCFIIVVRDITQILNTEVDLERSNEALQQFAAVASHDLQAPLRTISTLSSSILSTSKTLDEESRTRLGRIVAACGRMRELTDSLLSLARIHKDRLSCAPVPANEIFDELTRDLSAVIAESGGTLLRGELPVLWGDRAQLRQVFQNLLTNALKFRKPDCPPVVRVSAEPFAGGWKIIVADNGIGIDASYHGRIFGLFQRLHGRSQYPGSGIGLSTVKKIVELHHGTVGLSSVPGQGSSFWFTLPEDPRK